MSFNFDQITCRVHTNSYKYDLRHKVFGDADVLPFWVADMDFKVADEIIHDLRACLDHGIFGYTYHCEGLFDAVVQWMWKRHQWVVKPEEIVLYHGVVPSVNLAIQAFTKPGDAIIVQPPVYFPLFQSVENNNRQVMFNQLKVENGHYTIDYEHLERSINKQTKMMLFCHPHNPVGRVWQKDELEQLMQICLRYNILMISDEIHSDLVFSGHQHIPYAKLSEEAARQSITLVAPSKTFNIAGLVISCMIIPDQEIRKTVTRHIRESQLHGINLLGLAAFESAYRKGENWLMELLTYLEGNLDVMESFLRANLPAIALKRPEATCLAWMDFSATNLTAKEQRALLVKRAHVGLSEGPLFGPGGEGWQRFNFACPRSQMVKGLEQIQQAVEGLE